MQVTHTEDHVTHAVIGGAKQINMGISDSAEFFHILSSTLYSDQKLAVVRETVCNAWDAHIDAGCTDKAIAIKVDQTQIVIRDFGKGIPKDLIGPIYGVYGASTKKNDGNATGGFGLGCKSPFAYTDNFQVTSHCDGVRTIYNMSKSSALVGGKPSIIPIASFPTTESGIEVVIKLTSDAHYSTFVKLFKRIVYNGGMRATLNGEPMDALKTYAVKEGFFITDREILENHSEVAISYGNVIYPLAIHEQFRGEYHRAVSILQKAGGTRHYGSSTKTLVLFAPSNSISVTPSRESLSMQTHTIATVKQLLETFNTTYTKYKKNHTHEIVRTAVKRAARQKKFVNMISVRQQLPAPAAVVHQRNRENFVLFDRAYLAKLHVTTNYPEELERYDIRLRVSELMKAQYTTPGLGRSFLKELNKLKEITAVSNWAYKHVIWPLARKMAPIEGMSSSRLVVINNTETSYHQRDTGPIPAMSYQGKSLMTQMPFLRNIVIISYTRRDVESRLNRSPLLKELGSKGAMLLYAVPRSVERVAEARAFFAKTGHQVIDLTEPLPGEMPAVVEVVKPKVATKTAKPGLPVISEGLRASGPLSTELYWGESVLRNKEPEFVVLVTLSQKYDNSFQGHSHEESRLLAKYFGAVGGVVKNRLQMDRYIEKGATTAHKYIIPKVCDYIMKCPFIAERRAARLIYDDTQDYSKNDLINRINRHRLELGMISKPTQEATDYCTLWEGITHRWSHMPEVKAVNDYLESIPQTPDAKELNDNILNSSVMAYINAVSLVSGLVSPKPTIAAKALEVLKFICSN